MAVDLTPSLTCVSSALVALLGGSTATGAGKDGHLPIGLGSSSTKCRGYLGFSATDWAAVFQGVSSFKGATLKLFVTTSDVHLAKGGSQRILVSRLTAALAAGTSGGGPAGSEQAWSTTNGGGVVWAKGGGSNDGVAFTATNQADSGTISTGGWISIDISDLVEDALPAGIYKRSGAVAPGGVLYGLRLESFDDTSSARSSEFYSHESTSRPYVLLSLDDNHQPLAPKNITPADTDTVTTTTGTEFTVGYTHSDPLDPGSWAKKARVQVFAAGTTTGQMNNGTVLPLNDVTVSNLQGTQSGKVRVGIRTAGQKDPPLVRRTPVLFRVRTIDNKDRAGVWSAARTFTPNAKPLLVNIEIQQGTRTPTLTASISDPDSVLGGTAGRPIAARGVILLDLPAPDGQGSSTTTMLDTGKVTTSLAAARFTLPYSGSPSLDLDWGQKYRGYMEVWDDSDTTDAKSDQVAFEVTPRIVVGPVTVLPLGKDPLQTALTHAFTVGDTLPFDGATLRWYRDEASQVPFWAQTHSGMNTTLAAVPTGTTNVKVVSVANAVIGDIIRIAKTGGSDDRTITVVGTAGAGGTGLTLSATVAAASHAIGNAVQTLQMTRNYAGPTGLTGIDWATEPWFDAAVRPSGAVNYGPTSERHQIRIDAKPSAPGPISVVDGVDIGLGYVAVGTVTPTLVLPNRDPDLSLGYTDAPTRREIAMRRQSNQVAVGGSPFVITSGITDNWVVPGATVSAEITYEFQGRYDDAAAQRGPWSAWSPIRPSALPVVVAVSPPAAIPSGITSVAATDIITATAHGLTAGQAVKFTALTGGAGLVVGTTYYVIASNLAANTFMVSATVGGATVNHTTNITAGALGSIVTDPTPAIDWGVTLSGAKTQAQAQVILTDIDAVGAGGDPIEVYDSGIMDLAASVWTIPPFYLEATGRLVEVTVRAWDTDGLKGEKVWTFTTLFTTPAKLTGLSATPDQAASQVVLAWSAAAKDANFVEYRVYRRQQDEEFQRIDPGGLITEAFTDTEAPIGVGVDYRVTQHTGALESPSDAGSEESDIISPALRWRVLYGDAYNFDVIYVMSWRIGDPVNETPLQPLPGDDPGIPTFPIYLSGGTPGQTVTLSVLLTVERLDQMRALRDIRTQIARNGDYMVLKAPGGIGGVWRCKPGEVPLAGGGYTQTADITFTETA